MNDTAVVDKAAETKALTVIERAVQALGSTKYEADLRELIGNTSNITEVRNTAGRDQAHAAAMRLKSTRVDIEKVGKSARDDATKFSKAVIAEQTRLVDMITPEETRLLSLRDAWDEARAAEKRAKEEAERQRQAAVQAAIDNIRQFAVRVSGKSAADIDHASVELDFLTLDEATFGKRLEEAVAVRLETMDTLAKMHDRAIEAEEAAAAERQRAEAARIEQERIAAEQAAAAELLAARQRELDEAEARARAARAEEDRKAQAARDAADREQREAMVARQRELDAQEERLRAERRAAQEAADAQAAAARAAEQKRLDEEAAARRAAEEAAHAADIKLRDAAPALLAALRAMVNKATKQNWNDAYAEVLQQAFDAIESATA
ncbi:hypothetical protein [Robbsia andropogonis]|uniref:hypothetical protein n=1 Tax=Robbsia andropogonis TaxID=28092 RepID=UPI002A6AE1A3|nr:hypothetical protein [Robbsia andropogonis]